MLTMWNAVPTLNVVFDNVFRAALEDAARTEPTAPAALKPTRSASEKSTVERVDKAVLLATMIGRWARIAASTNSSSARPRNK